MGSHPPALEQRCHPMNARQQLRCGSAVSLQKGDLMPVPLAFQRQIAASHRYGPHCPARQNPRRTALGSRRKRPRCAASGCGRCRVRLSPPQLQSALCFPSAARELLAPRRPGRPHRPRPVRSADPVLLAGHPPRRTKPRGQRQSAVLKNRSRCNRCLTMAARAFQQGAAQRPELRPMATRTTKTLRPAQSKQILPTGFLTGKASLQFEQIPRIIFHDRKHYRLGSPE